ncbi:MAG TPA: MBL fold metallo-hydrolase [Bryobacteraceae bacterium]|nr:MBL fold metallo-hydrolase [Bryobacteraceae bacterium]
MNLACLCLLIPALACAADPLEIRVLFDNNAASPAFEKGWGFAAALQMGGRGLLFDAGAAQEIFVRNFDAMKLDASSFDRIMISHRHGDHTGGLRALEVRNPKLRILWPDPAEPYEVMPHFHSTGALNGPPPEQALVVETPNGLVIMTGCSHPGIVKLVEAALKQRAGKPVRYLIGGFHMLLHTPSQVSETIAALKKLNVERVAPTHCTGEKAIAMFRDAWGPDFETVGAGRVIVLD